ncbi:MAG: endo alpha-1,4 polygalactosaminidase [Ktedonobacterales bacterium]|nr:endo alpha-1,4 polygalactosaminidase [Ktedonobacterales bacterium]
MRHLGQVTLPLLFMVTMVACNQASSTSVTTPGSTTPLPPGQVWHPALQSSWQWQLDDSTLDPALKVQVYDFDGFDRSADDVAQLHAQGTKVICYIDVGTWEMGRPDSDKFPAALKGKPVDGFPDEKWLDIRQLSVLEPLISARMDICKEKGFDAIEPDNVDGYANDSGFPLTADEQLAFNTFLAKAAHQRGLSVGLKNDLDQVQQLLPLFDWALNEQCFQYHECAALLPFIQANKAVFNVEYKLNPDQFCSKANAMNFNSLKKHLALDAFRVACR